ncbi:MAG: hypothetical protein B5M51_07675 [Anaerolinea sp. 4484_236]|nr:MAG: hypothetical protein B5M51_07675 [Anaerolinea sp. 4484_236]
MAEKDWLLGDTPNPLGERIAEIREKLQEKDPEILAAQTGAIYSAKGDTGGDFQLPFWSQDVLISFPDFVGKYVDTGVELNSFDMTMLAYYFDASDGAPVAGEWIAFNQIPGGMFYAQAFQNYSGNELLKVFGDDLNSFVKANEKLGGQSETFGNAAYSYQILPHVPIMAVCWLGDEDFPSSYRILFDTSAHHHLVTYAYAILGSNLARQLIKTKG